MTDQYKNSFFTSPFNNLTVLNVDEMPKFCEACCHIVCDIDFFDIVEHLDQLIMSRAWNRMFFPKVDENDETLIIPRIEYCRSEHMTIFVGCIYVYKGLLMVSQCKQRIFM